MCIKGGVELASLALCPDERITVQPKGGAFISFASQMPTVCLTSAPPTGVVCVPFQVDITEHIMTLFVGNKSKSALQYKWKTQEVDNSCL